VSTRARHYTTRFGPEILDVVYLWGDGVAHSTVGVIGGSAGDAGDGERHLVSILIASP
jgi:hypothetical protein